MNEIREIVSGKFSSTSKYVGKQFSKKRITDSFEIELFEDDYYHTVINDKKIPYRKGTVVIAKPGDTRHSKLHFTCRFIHLKLSEGELLDFYEGAGNLIYVTDPEEYRRTFERIAELFSEGKNDFEMQAQIYHLTAMLSRDSVEKAPVGKGGLEGGKNQSDKPYLTILTNYLENNYREKITLETLAKKVNLHPNYVHRIFKKAYGKTPSEYLGAIRLNHAKYMLINTDAQIGEIAFKCGFNSQTYFSNSFEKSFGVSPFVYRKEKRNLL